MKMTVKSRRDLFRPSLSLAKEAKMAPKKQPAVRSETTFWEMCVLYLLANPVLPRGRPKSFLKLVRESTELITPVSYPVFELVVSHAKGSILKMVGQVEDKQNSRRVKLTKQQ